MLGRLENSIRSDLFEIDSLAALLTLLINQNPAYNKIWVCGGPEDLRTLLIHHIFNKFYNPIYLIRTSTTFITFQLHLYQGEVDGILIDPVPSEDRKWITIIRSVLDVVYPVYSLRIFTNTNSLSEKNLLPLTIARRLAKRNWYNTREDLLRSVLKKEGSIYLVSSVPDYLIREMKSPGKYQDLLRFPIGDWPERLGIRLLAEVPRDRLPYYLGIWPIFWSPNMVAIPANIFEEKRGIWIEIRKFNLTYSISGPPGYRIIMGQKRDLDRWLISTMSGTTESKLESGCSQPLGTYFL